MDIKKIGILAGCLVLIVVYFWTIPGEETISTSKFPDIPPGNYHGTIEWTGTVADHLYFENGKNGRYLITTSGGGVITKSPPGEDEAPLILELPSGEQLVFTGGSVRYGNYQGTVTSGNRIGNWSLKIVQSVSEESPPDLESISQMVSLRQNRLGLHQEHDELRKMVEEKSEEARRLTLQLADSTSLKKNADKKFRELREGVDDLEALVNQKVQTVKELQNKVSLAQRVTPSGQLVSLSRKSIDREMRWFESMFKGSDMLSGSGVGSEYDRALLKVELRNQIMKLREVVNRLKTLAQNRRLYEMPY